MRYWIIGLLLAVSGAALSDPVTDSSTDLVVVIGAPGTEEYGEAFSTAAEAWEEAGKVGAAAVTVIGREKPAQSDLAELQSHLEAHGPDESRPLWIVLLGHGTFDGREAKFNLRGKDLSATELAAWLQDSKRPIAIVNCSASSAPFIKKLTQPGRVIITGTKSGSEDSYARFGEYLAKSINSPEADLDRDGGTSLLEAFLAAAKEVEEFYEKEGRIATEQSLVDDNGDGFGTPAQWFRGVRAVKKAKDDAEPDGLRTHQFHLVPSAADQALSAETRAQRDALEAELLALRAKKDDLAEGAYYLALEKIARQLAALYGQSTSDD